MTRATIISDLMTCLTTMAPEYGPYVAAARVERGIRLASEMPERPALALFNERVETKDLAADQAERVLIMHLWGAADAPEGTYGELDQLAASCVGALADPALNPHWSRTSCGAIEVYEGGASDPIGMFDMELRVTYESASNTL